MTPQTALPAAFSHTFLSEHTEGQETFPQLLQLGSAKDEITIKRRLSLAELHGCAVAAVAYANAKINLETLQYAGQYATYFKCIGIGHYHLKDDNGAVFNVEHRKSDDKWSLLANQETGWINQEYINRKLSQQSAA